MRILELFFFGKISVLLLTAGVTVLIVFQSFIRDPVSVLIGLLMLPMLCVSNIHKQHLSLKASCVSVSLFIVPQIV